eukprot:XP_023971304.1 uncharacterized protein LOC102976075 [Physeter catodon]
MAHASSEVVSKPDLSLAPITEQRMQRQETRFPGLPGRAAETAASEQPEEEAEEKMPLSLPPHGDHGESSPSRTPKKHASFHIWRSKKKQQPPRSDCGVFIPHPPPKKQQPPRSDCGVFIPHPPPAPLGEASALEVVDGGHVAGECQEFTLHGESRFFHTACEVPGPLPTESGMFKKSSAQPPEENKRKPVLGKLGTLFTAGRRRNTRNGLESPTSSNAKSFSPKVTSSKLPETETEKSQLQGSQRKQTDTCEEDSPQEKCQEPEGQRSEGCVQAAPPDAERSPGSGSRAAEAAVQHGHESDSPQLEPLEAEGETFPDATTAAKQLHSSLENSSGQENASPGAGREQEPARGARGVPGSPAGEQPADGAARVCDQGGSPEHQDAPSQPPEDASAPAGHRPAEGSENQAGSAPANSKADPPGRDCRPQERAHPAKSRG